MPFRGCITDCTLSSVRIKAMQPHERFFRCLPEVVITVMHPRPAQSQHWHGCRHPPGQPSYTQAKTCSPRRSPGYRSVSVPETSFFVPVRLFVLRLLCTGCSRGLDLFWVELTEREGGGLQAEERKHREAIGTVGLGGFPNGS